MLAEVYTFPADAKAKPEVVIEAAVTETTCGRELLGETLSSAAVSYTHLDVYKRQGSTRTPARQSAS